MKALHGVSFILVIIGALNWGLVGVAAFVDPAANWNVVNLVLGQWPEVEWAIYVLVGLAGLSLLGSHKRDCKWCSSGSM